MCMFKKWQIKRIKNFLKFLQKISGVYMEFSKSTTPRVLFQMKISYTSN